MQVDHGHATCPPPVLLPPLGDPGAPLTPADGLHDGSLSFGLCPCDQLITLALNASEGPAASLPGAPPAFLAPPAPIASPVPLLHDAPPALLAISTLHSADLRHGHTLGADKDEYVWERSYKPLISILPFSTLLLLPCSPSASTQRRLRPLFLQHPQAEGPQGEEICLLRVKGGGGQAYTYMRCL